MSKLLTEYLKPGKVLILVALLLVTSMCLQFYILPPVLKLKSDGETLQGTTIGIILIFSYTTTTLGLLFLITEYFNMKSRVKTYSKLTEFQNIQEEPSKQVALAQEPKKAEKPKKRGLFSGIFKKKEGKKGQMKEDNTGPKIGLLPSSSKSNKSVEKTQTEKPRTGLFSKLRKNNEQKKDKKTESTEANKITQKTIKIEATSKQAVEIPVTSTVANNLVPEIKIVKVPEVVPPTPQTKETEQLIKPKSDSGVTDLLKSNNESPKVKIPESESVLIKPASNVNSFSSLLRGAGDYTAPSTPSTTSNVQKTAQIPVVMVESGIKTTDTLKVTTELPKEAEDTLQKYKTVVIKVPDTKTDDKPEEKPLEIPEVPIQVTKKPQEPEIDISKIYEDSEFLKALTDLRTVVNELKTKKKKPIN